MAQVRPPIPALGPIGDHRGLTPARRHTTVRLTHMARSIIPFARTYRVYGHPPRRSLRSENGPFCYARPV